MWISAHVRIRGYEEADSLAKNRTNGNSIDIVNIPFTIYNRNIEANVDDSNVKYFQKKGQIKGISYFKNYYNEKRIPWYSHAIIII